MLKYLIKKKPFHGIPALLLEISVRCRAVLKLLCEVVLTFEWNKSIWPPGEKALSSICYLCWYFENTAFMTLWLHQPTTLWLHQLLIFITVPWCFDQGCSSNFNAEGHSQFAFIVFLFPSGQIELCLKLYLAMMTSLMFWKNLATVRRTGWTALQ